MKLKSTLEIGGLKVESGSRSIGMLNVGPYFPHRRAHIRKFVRIPFAVVNGADDGPIFCVTAGLHPTEYGGISAAIRLSKDVEPKDLKGALVIIPVVNIPAYDERSYICPIDGVNPQGIFPGRTDRTICHLIIFRVFDEFIKKADYYVDLHGGDIHESELCYSYFYRTGDEAIDLKSEGIAKALGLKYVIPRATGEVEGYSWRVAPEHGIPSAICECNQGDRLLLDEASRVFEGLLNVMRYLEMIEGMPRKVEGQESPSKAWITVGHGGLLHTRVKLGDLLSEGDIIGEVMDLYGNVVETLKSPYRGVILFMIHNPKVDAGERIIGLGKQEDT